MYFRILGPLRVQANTAQPDDPSPASTVPVTGRRQQVILSVLLVNLGETVSLERLVDALWRDAPPPKTCREQVQNCAAALRRSISPPARKTRETHDRRVTIVADPSGYRLHASRSAVDAFAFEDGIRATLRRHPVPDAEVERRLRSALKLWSGAPFAGLSAVELQAEAARLEELRMLAVEELVSQELHTAEVPALRVADLCALIRRYPYRERLWLLLMEALHRCGRTAEALERFREYRTTLVDGHGVEPGPAIQEKARTILAAQQ